MKGFVIAIIVLVVLFLGYKLYKHKKKCSRSITKTKDGSGCGCGCNGSGDCEKKTDPITVSPYNDNGALEQGNVTTEDILTSDLNESILIDPYAILELPPDQGTGAGGGMLFPNDIPEEAQENFLMQTRASSIMRTYFGSQDWIVALDVSEGVRDTLVPEQGLSVIWKKPDSEWKRSDVKGIALTARDGRLYLVRILRDGYLYVYTNSGAPGKWEKTSSFEDLKKLSPELFNELLLQVKAYIDLYKDFVSLHINIDDYQLAELITQ